MEIILKHKPEYCSVLGKYAKKYEKILGFNLFIYGKDVDVEWEDSWLVPCIMNDDGVKRLIEKFGSEELYDLIIQLNPSAARWIPDDFYKMLGLLRSPDSYCSSGVENLRDYDMIAALKGVDYHKFDRHEYYGDPLFMTVVPQFGKYCKEDDVKPEYIGVIEYMITPSKRLILEHRPELYMICEALTDDELVGVAARGVKVEYKCFKNKSNYYRAAVQLIKYFPDIEYHIDGTAASIWFLKNLVIQSPFSVIRYLHSRDDSIKLFALVVEPRIARSIKLSNWLADLLLDMDIENVKFLREEHHIVVLERISRR